MDYDATLSFRGVNFGLIDGESILLIAKTGSGGNIYGHEQKYLNLSKYINEKYAVSVIVSDNPVDL